MINPMTQSEDSIQQFLNEENTVMIAAPEWFNRLKECVNDLVQNDFQKLVQLLYQVDVSEPKLKNALSTRPTADAAEIIARLLVERQLQKIKSRREMTQRDDAISEEERWQN
jgi:hypothetical protein